MVELLGRDEAGEADPAHQDLLRLLTPIAKLMTGKQSVVVLSEIIESFGGAGYVEDTGIPQLLRDAQVFPIWEGTTNVLSLDALRVAASGRPLEALEIETATLASSVRAPELLECVQQAESALTHATRWLTRAQPDVLEAGARSYAMTIGRAFALLLMARHGQWLLDHGGERRGCLSAIVFCRRGVDMIDDRVDPALSRSLMQQSPGSRPNPAQGL